MKYKRYDFENYRVHTIKTDKFKTCVMEVIFRCNIEKESITKWNFLIDMLTHSSKKYPKRKDLVLELEDLYNASLRGISSRVGKTYMASIVTNFLDPKYLDEETLKKVIELPLELINNPNVLNDEFDLRSFKIIKNKALCDIDGLKEQSLRYALRRCLSLMDEESPSGYSMVGYKEDLEKITPSNLYKTYLDFLKKVECDIFVIGNLDMDDVVRIIDGKYNNPYINDNELELLSNSKKLKKKMDIIEEGNYEQDTMVMVYNIGELTKYERDIVMHVYNYLLGGGSLTTKLGIYLRETNSLCYDVGSLYQKHDSLEIIYAGIDKKNYEKAVKLAKKAVKDMSKGNISDREFEEAKLQLISSLKINQDSQGGIINNYFFNYIDDLPLQEERIEMFKNVKKEEVIKVANKVNLNICYLLRKDGK